MRKWAIFYADGGIWYSNAKPRDVPGLGVVVIVQEHDDKQERPYFQWMTDYYIWLGDRWSACDLFGMWQYIFVDKYGFEKVALAGQTVSNEMFRIISDDARALREKWHDPTDL